MDKISKVTRLYILPIYWAFLTYMLLKPGNENQEHWFMFPGFDKVIHCCTFGFLGLIFLLAFPKTKFFTYFQIILSFGFLSEILQDLMDLGRALEAGDVAADACGAVFGWWSFNILRSLLEKMGR